MGKNLDAVRAAVESAKVLAEEFQSGTAKFYIDGNTDVVFESTCRLKKPKTSSYDAGNQTQWSTKRETQLKIPLTAGGNVIQKGMICQISTTDGDEAINHINFTVQSSLGGQFAAERTIMLVTEVNKTDRIT